MKTLSLRLPLLLTAVALLSACGASHPLRISDERWARMSHDEQLRAYQQQAEQETERTRIRAEARNEELRLRAEAAEREQARLDERRYEAHYGDLIQCVLEPVAIHSRKAWQPARPLAFELVRGETLPLTLEATNERRSVTAWTHFDDNGLALALCRNHSEHNGLSDCAEVLGTTREFSHGIRRSLQLDGFVQGDLRCDLVRPRQRH